MYAGHFAIGLAIKAKFPKVPALPIMMGVGFLDILDGLFILAGFDRVTPNLQSGPYLFFDLTFIDWDHSFLMAVIWSLCWGALFLKSKQVAVIAALAAFSHFIADLPLHNNDLALYPYSEGHLGFGLWGKLGTNSWLLEGVFAALLAVYAWRANAQRGVSSLWPCLLLSVVFVQLSPWLSPMKFVATFSEPAAHLVHGALVTLGFLVPGLLFSWLLNRAEQHAKRT
jgi:hypothetical protein